MASDGYSIISTNAFTLSVHASVTGQWKRHIHMCLWKFSWKLVRTSFNKVLGPLLFTKKLQVKFLPGLKVEVRTILGDNKSCSVVLCSLTLSRIKPSKTI